MFEKEAEEYAEKKICQEYSDGCMGFYKCKEDCERYHNTQKYWKAGAEFGYNKANEWHRVSDKLPEMDVFVYLWTKGKDFPVVAYRHSPYGQKEWVWNCEWGSGFSISQLKGRDYLWKEIELPKES